MSSLPLFLLSLFVVVIPFYVWVRSKAWESHIQPHVEENYPGYQVYHSPFGMIPLWILYKWINFRYSMRYPYWGKTPKIAWFTGGISLTESGASFGEGSPLEYAGSLHPYFLGYSWYRSYTLETTQGVYMFFTPWVWPQESRTPVVLFKGESHSCWQVVREFLFGLIFHKDYPRGE